MIANDVERLERENEILRATCFRLLGFISNADSLEDLQRVKAYALEREVEVKRALGYSTEQIIS